MAILVSFLFVCFFLFFVFFLVFVLFSCVPGGYMGKINTPYWWISLRKIPPFSPSFYRLKLEV